MDLLHPTLFSVTELFLPLVDKWVMVEISRSYHPALTTVFRYLGYPGVERPGIAALVQNFVEWAL